MNIIIFILTIIQIVVVFVIKLGWAAVMVSVSVAMGLLGLYVGVMYVLPAGVAFGVAYAVFMGLKALVKPRLSPVLRAEKAEREDLRKKLQKAGASEHNIAMAVAALQKEQDTPYVRTAKKVVKPTRTAIRTQGTGSIKPTPRSTNPPRFNTTRTAM